MFGVTTSDDYKPVTWVGRYPIDVTTLLVGIHIGLMLVAVFLVTFERSWLLEVLKFDSAQVLQSGAVWQLATYAFVHPPAGLLWFAVEMYLLFFFGREVERYIGRRSFIWLYALLLLGPSIFLTIWGLGQRVGLPGSAALHFAVFIAFATIHPEAEFLLRLTAKWVAIILAAIYTLQLLAYHVWWELAVLWLSIGTAFFFIRLRGIGPELVWWDNLVGSFKPKPKFTVVQKPSSRRTVEPESVHESIDPILEKISKHGIDSLTSSERGILDRARNRLLKDS